MSAIIFGGPEAAAVVAADRMLAAKAKREAEVAEALKGVKLAWYRVTARVTATCEVLAPSAQVAEKIAEDCGDWDTWGGDVTIDDAESMWQRDVTPSDAERYAIEHVGLKRVRERAEILAVSGGDA